MITLLHVDDSEQELWLASKYINQLSDYVRLIQTSSIEEALDIARKTRIDCILTDYQMPEADGMEFFREVRTFNTSVPFVLLTGKGNERIASDAIKAGVDAYLIKEGDLYFYEELLRTVRRLTESRRQQAEQEEAMRVLQHSDKYLKDVQRVARIGYCTLNISTGYWQSSEILDEIFGLDDDFTRTLENWLQLIEPRYRESFLYHLQSDALAKKGRLDIEYPIRKAGNGELVWVHNLGTVSFDSNDNPVSLVGTIQDITERKESTIKLQQSEEKFRAYVSTSPNAIFVAGKEGNYLDVNPAASKITGYSREELLSMNVMDLISQDSIQTAENHFRQVLEKGTASGEFAFTKKSGEKGFWMLEARTLESGDLLGVTIDITDKKREQMLLQTVAGLMSDIMIGWNTATDAVQFYGPVEEALGYQEEDQPDRIEGLLSFIHPQDHDLFSDMRDSVLAGNAVTSNTIRARHKDGRWLPLSVERIVLPEDELLSDYRLAVCSLAAK